MEMLKIFVDSEQFEEVKSIIQHIERLDEVVSVQEKNAQNEQNEDFGFLSVHKHKIHLPLDWANHLPPYLFPFSLDFTQNNVLALAFMLLGNYEKAYQFASSNETLLQDIDMMNCLQHGVPFMLDLESSVIESEEEQYRFYHNAAIKAHYGELNHFFHVSNTKNLYKKAIELAPNDEYKAFSAKHLATLLLDLDELRLADEFLQRTLALNISDWAKMELHTLCNSLWMKQLVVPYDADLLEKIKQNLAALLQFYEAKGAKIPVALLLIDASHIANITNSFTESLGYISKAIHSLEEENLPEFLGNAQFRKGTLLFTWAQNGNPQFYKGAMEAYQQACKVFTKENHPAVFAEIHGYLGVIYSEIPDEAKKKGIWAAVSTSSFKEALSYFTRETHLYEYAMLCNNYANALTKFPSGVLTDNYAKAMEFYEEALEIRNAIEFPYERALTLLNYLEACWYVSQDESEQAQQALYQKMLAAASEIENLVDDSALISCANEHLLRLKELAEINDFVNR